MTLKESGAEHARKKILRVEEGSLDTKLKSSFLHRGVVGGRALESPPHKIRTGLHR